ncbi:hypothetical protein P153DRAFT_367248 [Dothidotthia symphoricarpi CBS 119687]|uniref:Uncharacterized protein n=1 Tax=Dothidotthia symphoricarpi CBS 119687 TaxID=1392245 RepID=A0A6A6AD97_9PLEO|nr:uncharacterized protein P153DRAFT_367248 [Dothidotthia symphoricarpi CBS 119687]KAF2128944.1 hypothetical protein P153DRAFT_367248 [Dothidotthia symphoricarpi CBS 119687]
MAVTLKRKRGAVSYKEPSTDEDSSDDLAHAPNPEWATKRTRAAPSQRSTRHRQVRDSNARPQPDAIPTRSRAKTEPRGSQRQRGRNISYKDVSSDEEEDPDADFEEPQQAREASRRPSRSRTLAVRPLPSQKRRTSKARSQRGLVLGAPRKPQVLVDTVKNVVSIPTDGHKPDWASLPYHVLLQVFVYASYPLHDENLKPAPSISWLVQMARMCSAFTKPALTALYRNPPIFAIKQTRKGLVHHLITTPSEAHENYQVMVKRLDLDVTQMTALTDATHSVADLAALIKSLTTLREIDIFDPIDRPPFRERLRRMRRWFYPDELFAALRQSDLRLRSWRWNSTLCQQTQDSLWMKTVHGDRAFTNLRELTLTKFHPSPSRDDGDDENSDDGQPTAEELLASALAVLPDLKSLSFETCGVVSGRLLPLLPQSLVCLNITNCGELLSDALQSFLTTHGAQLEELVLNHNQSLDLSFLVDLKRSCPKLEVLQMDTTYYSSLEMSSDNEPLYDQLLGEDEIPTWPSTLRIIDLEYLRNWNSIAANNFFQSLIDSAEDLPWLREITILAMVDTDWRQRAEFRRKWSATFKRVFARNWVPPSHNLVSLKAFREWKAEEVDAEKVDSFIEGVSEEMDKANDTAKTYVENDSDTPLLSLREQDERWNQKRLRSRSKAPTSHDEASDDESASEAESDDEDRVLCVQGLCHTVIFRIDNFRPREEIYNEADFLDAEPSGDEEWNGNDDNEDEEGYAW